MLYDLGRGAIVGEMALLTDRPRAATVHAVRDSELLLLRVSSFTSLLERSPALVTGMIRLLVDRLLAVDRLLIADRPQAPPPVPRHRRGLRRPQRPARPRWSPGGWPAQLARAGPVFLVDADVGRAAAGPRCGAAGTGRARPGRADRVAARASNAPMTA